MILANALEGLWRLRTQAVQLRGSLTGRRGGRRSASASEDAIIGWTTDGVVTNWNSGAERMYGYAADEIVGRHVTVLSLPDRAEEFAPVLDQLVRGEHVQIFDTKARRKDGSIIDVSISLSPIRSPGGVVTGVSSVARDITERNRAEAERLSSAAAAAGG